ncbi:MAG: DNA cytosine methyltransferase [Verrucomicrobiota bacterium]
MSYHIVDLFCGAGGTSAGAVEAVTALGKRPKVTAINHWPVAIDTHTVNHPDSRHLCTGIDAVNPRELYREGQLDMLWASPECTHHSIARGGKPINDQSRATAWCVVRWAEALRPPVILIENVPEFQTWGPIGSNGRPLASRKGETFRAWLAALESLGYKTDFRLLCAADYGDPTTRTRLFVQAVRGRRKIVWPEATHSKDGDLLASRRWVAAREIIDWELEGKSIYERKRPLSEKTMARIMAGLRKYGLKPSVVTWDHQSGSGLRSDDEPLSTITTKARHGVAQPFLVHLRGGSAAHVEASGRDLDEPAPAITAGGQHLGLVSPFLVKTANGGESAGRTRSVDEPMPTVCGNRGDVAVIEPALLPQQSGGRLRPVDEPAPTVATDGAIALVEPFLVSFYGNGQAHDIDQPSPTVTTKDRFGLVRPVVEIDGNRYLLDIRFRMLQPHELALAQGFPKGYEFTGTKTDQVKQIGNAVPRRLARAIVGAVLSQNPNVTSLVEAEEGKEVAA